METRRNESGVVKSKLCRLCSAFGDIHTFLAFIYNKRHGIIVLVLVGSSAANKFVGLQLCTHVPSLLGATPFVSFPLFSPGSSFF